MKDENLPATAGTYALKLQIGQEQIIQIGSLGRFALNTGYYLYLGSAFGPGGLRGRLTHHLHPVNRPCWHIDYLRSAAQVTEIWYTLDPHRREHQWALAAGNLPASVIPLAGFGASDCRCVAHLFYYPIPPCWDDFCNSLMSSFPGHAQIQRLQI
jgi:Uri superfamily endonuclease